MSDQTPTDPWQDVKEYWAPNGYYAAADVTRARALTDEQHQREIADLTKAVQGNALAVVKCSENAAREIAQRDETIRQLQARLDEKFRDINQVLIERDVARRDLAEARKLGDLAYSERKIAELTRALQSIANSACCGCCQEAALVARAALLRETTDPQRGAPTP